MLMTMYMSSRLSASFTERSRLKDKRFIYNYIFVYVGKDLYVFVYFSCIILNNFKLSIQRFIPMIVKKSCMYLFSYLGVSFTATLTITSGIGILATGTLRGRVC